MRHPLNLLRFALLALLAWTTSPAFAQTAPWKQYLGANTGGGFSPEVWCATIRGGYPRGSNNASMSSTIDAAKLDEVLAVSDWINLQDGYNYRQQTDVDNFFNAVRADHGAAWRTNCALMAQAMVDGQVRNAATGRKAYWELGNEIYASNPPQTIGAWIAANNLPYPHPNSPFNDNPTHAAQGNDRGIIGYQVEYQIALALEAILGVNATAPTGHKVRILPPASTGGSIQNGSATGWTSTLLNYVIVGYEVEKDANGNTFTNFSKPLASSLAGQRLGDLVDIVNVHYIIAANGTTLNTVFNTWTGGTNHATGVFHTEEGGINAANGGRGGLSAMQNFARANDVWLTRGLTPADARLIYYASGDGPAGTRGTDALTELHGFMPADTTVLARKPGLLSSGAAVLETYTFENADASKRALFVLPGNNTAVNFTSVTMQAGGWNWTDVAGTARVWSSTANAASTATVTRAGDGSSYTISFPSVTNFTTSSQQGLVIFLTGSSPAALEILTPATLPFGAVNAAYSQTLAAAGGSAPYSWTVTAGALPAGLSFSSAGLLSGTPTTLGTASFTATVTDAAGATASRTFSITISAAGPSITTTALPNGAIGAAYSQTLAATGGTEPYTWSIFSGALPGGLTLSSAGVISGTPTASGTFTFAVEVDDAASATASKTLSIVVDASGALAITTASPLPSATVLENYTQTFAASGGSAPYTWSLAGGSLPPTMNLNSNGILTGAPSATGTFNFTVRVTDSASAQATKTFSLTVNPFAGGDGPWENLADGSQGRTTSFTASSGENVAAYFRKPAGTGPFPLVLLIHGGAASHNTTYALGRSSNPPAQDFVAAGFAVYSIDFALDPGPDGEVDLAARAIETARQLDGVDARRVGIMGQSHGGNVTVRTAIALDVLCAIPCAPATGVDLIECWKYQQTGATISATLQNAIDNFVNQVPQLYGVDITTLAADPSAYGWTSSVTEAGQVRFPLFIVAGQNDTSAPIPVLDAYTTALAANGKIFETYYPADGPHGFVLSSPLIPETYEFATRAVAFLNEYFSLADTDTDGLPDGWELSRFNSLAQGPTDDPDSDGQNNLAEWRAGTHPLDNASVMQISAITLTPAGQATLRFPLVPGLGHVVDFSGDLQTWQTIAAPVFTEPQTGFAEWTDDGTLTGGAAARRFYRVRVP